MDLNKFEGIIPPLVTPLTAPDVLDVGGLERLVENVLAGGVHGLFVLGTTGEGPSLSYRLRHEMVERVCRQVGDRVPVLVGITDTAFAQALEMAEIAAAAGAAAVVAAPPYYFPTEQTELLEYVKHLVVRLPLPLFLYNMPSLCKVAYQPDLIRQALEMPGVVGIKDSSGDLEYFQEVSKIVAEYPHATLLMGPEELLVDAMRLGGHGGIPGGANLCPALFVELYQAVKAGDAARTDALQADVERLGRLYQVGGYGSAVIKGIKCALSWMGLCDDFMAEPFQRFSQHQREIIQRLIDEMPERFDVKNGNEMFAMKTETALTSE